MCAFLVWMCLDVQSHVSHFIFNHIISFPASTRERVCVSLCCETVDICTFFCMLMFVYSFVGCCVREDLNDRRWNSFSPKAFWWMASVVTLNYAVHLSLKLVWLLLLLFHFHLGTIKYSLGVELRLVAIILPSLK